MTITKAMKEFKLDYENVSKMHKCRKYSKFAYEFLNLVLSGNEVMLDEFFNKYHKEVEITYNFFKEYVGNEYECDCYVSEVKKYIIKNRKVA